METEIDPEKDAESQAEPPLSEEMLDEVSGGGAADEYTDFHYTLGWPICTGYPHGKRRCTVVGAR